MSGFVTLTALWSFMLSDYWTVSSDHFIDAMIFMVM